MYMYVYNELHIEAEYPTQMTDDAHTYYHVSKTFD